GLDEPHSYEFLRQGRVRHRYARRATRLNLKLPQMGYKPGSAAIAALLAGGAQGVYLYRDPRAVATSLARLSLRQGKWADLCPQDEVSSLAGECGQTVPPGYDRWSSWRRCLHHI